MMEPRIGDLVYVVTRREVAVVVRLTQKDYVEVDSGHGLYEIWVGHLTEVEHA